MNGHSPTAPKWTVGRAAATRSQRFQSPGAPWAPFHWARSAANSGFGMANARRASARRSRGEGRTAESAWLIVVPPCPTDRRRQPTIDSMVSGPAALLRLGAWVVLLLSAIFLLTTGGTY